MKKNGKNEAGRLRSRARRRIIRAIKSIKEDLWTLERVCCPFSPFSEDVTTFLSINAENRDHVLYGLKCLMPGGKQISRESWKSMILKNELTSNSLSADALITSTWGLMESGVVVHSKTGEIAVADSDVIDIEPWIRILNLKKFLRDRWKSFLIPEEYGSAWQSGNPFRMLLGKTPMRRHLAMCGNVVRAENQSEVISKIIDGDMKLKSKNRRFYL